MRVVLPSAALSNAAWTIAWELWSSAELGSSSRRIWWSKQRRVQEEERRKEKGRGGEGKGREGEGERGRVREGNQTGRRELDFEASQLTRAGGAGRTSGFRMRALAIATRCFSPPDRPTLPSPMTVSKRSGRDWTKS